MIDLWDCTLEPLHEDGELILYRAVHACPGDGVARSVLVVGPAGGYVSPATLARLEHEYSMAGERAPRWALRRGGRYRHPGRAGPAPPEPGGARPWSSRTGGASRSIGWSACRWRSVRSCAWRSASRGPLAASMPPA